MRLIDADKLLFDVSNVFSELLVGTRKKAGADEILRMIYNAPTVDPVKHGRWDLIDGCEPVRYGCSVCHRMVWHHENYCPSCGAKMDEEADHDDHL